LYGPSRVRTFARAAVPPAGTPDPAVPLWYSGFPHGSPFDAPEPGLRPDRPPMSSRLARSAGVVGFATMTSRLLGVARESALAYVFGASATMQMDAFNVAFRIPNLLRDLFAEGAMTAAFVPTFTRAMNDRGRDAAWRLGSLVINTLLLITGILVVLGMIFAEPLTRAIVSAEEFAAQPGKLD
jgi:putative peptidoglycan lipid II flippase